MADYTHWYPKVDASVPGHPVATLGLDTPGFQPQQVRLKGVCYSPVPIGGSTNFSPNIGDFFWDTFKVDQDRFTVNGWDALWRRDLDRLRAMGVNCIRLYSVLSHHYFDDGKIPDPDSPQFKERLRGHKNFLDACFDKNDRPMYVLVGLPLPSCMLWKEQYDAKDFQAAVKFWNYVAVDTVRQVADHPAVLGFTLFNELADGAHSLDDPVKASFFWGQVQTIARQVKAVAPHKLVGFGLHDNPNFTGSTGKQYLATLSSVDFYGVNTYQHETVEPVFGPTAAGVGYRGLTGGALKPVIITEWGMPATTRGSLVDPRSITTDASTIEKTAECIDLMVPKIFAEKLCLGLFYFEYCDEWWKQNIRFSTIKALGPAYAGWIDKIKPDDRKDDGLFGAVYIHWGGPPNSNFPNGFWDEAGFGLYGVVRGQGVPLINEPYGPAVDNSIGPALPIDTHMARARMIEVLTKCYTAIKQ